jgi:ATP-dependent exoDNAse (exonuclease V) alpha subunit
MPSIKPMFSYTKQTKKQVIDKSLWENFVVPNKIKTCKQMKVMLIKNQYPTLGLVNGTIGIVHETVLNHNTPRNDIQLIKRHLQILVDLILLLLTTNCF